MYVYRARNLSGPLLTNDDQPVAGACEESSGDEEECKKVVQGDTPGREADLQAEVQFEQDCASTGSEAQEEAESGV